LILKDALFIGTMLCSSKVGKRKRNDDEISLYKSFHAVSSSGESHVFSREVSLRSMVTGGTGMSFKKVAPLGIVCGSSKSKNNLWLSGMNTVVIKDNSKNTVNLGNEIRQIPLFALGRGFDICFSVPDNRR
jgi:hypothetical protein